MHAPTRDVVAEVSTMAEEFRADAADRDRAAGTPWPQRERIRASGLLKLMVPEQYGGLGGTFPVLLRSVRELATADASLAHLFGYHHLGLVTPHLIGTPDQRAHWYALTARDNLFWGNALNPLDTRTLLERSVGQSTVLSGKKSFCTGAQGSDLLLTSATEANQSRLQVAVLPTRRDGVMVHDDWDNMGQRQTDSGSVSFDAVRVYDDELLGPPGAGGSVFATLRTCITQCILSNIFLGVAQGALAEARKYTLALEKPFAGSTAESLRDDPYVLEHYGEMFVATEATACLLDVAAERLQAAWEREDALTPDERGACAVIVSTAKVAAGRAAMDVTSRVFEVMGARATAERYRFDRFWRNVRTLTLHDPLDYKVREVGDWALNARVPTPSFYS